VAQQWDVVIGLEVHAQLRTAAKLFSSAPNSFGAEPNSQTTEVDLGMPGVLPVINGEAVDLAVRVALALDCEVQPVSRFARKHYFYPDLPKGYQISQYEEPYCIGGAVPIQVPGQEPRAIELTRIHMEEDAGKSIHDDAITGSGVSHVDLNRAGVPLIEIVSEPTIKSAEEAAAYVRSLRSILRYLEVSDADMEKGNLRCDGNISLRPSPEHPFGIKVEVKNVNSFRHLERALGYEIDRQREILEEGGEIKQETRHWDERADCTQPGRGKEDADDYRYFPEPDLMPLQIDEALIESVKASLPELPHQKRARYVAELGLSEEDAAILSEDRSVATFFEEAAALHGQAKTVANWVMRSVLAALSETGRPLDELPITPGHLARLLELIDAGKLTAANGREIFSEIMETGGEPAEIMQQRGLEAVSDAGELEALARQVIDDSPKQLEQYRAGQQKVLNYFLGQVMKATRGKADPAAVREIMLRLLSSSPD